MQENYDELQKAFKDLKEFNDELDGYKPHDYFEYKSSIDEAKEKCRTLPPKIHSLDSEIGNYDLRRPDLLEMKSKKDKVLQALGKIEDDIRELINRVNKQEERFQGMSPEEVDPNRRKDSFGGQMKLITMEKNADVLEKRRKDLEDIKQTSSQVNQLSEVMKAEVNEQGEMLNDIEANVNKADNNIVKAKEQIKQADSLQKSGRKRTLCLVLIIVLVVIVIVGIIVGVVVGKGKK